MRLTWRRMSYAIQPGPTPDTYEATYRAWGIIECGRHPEPCQEHEPIVEVWRYCTSEPLTFCATCGAVVPVSEDAE